VRRGLLLVVLLVVLAVGWRLWPSGGDDTTETAPEPTPTPTATSTPSDSRSPSAEPTKTKKETKPSPDLEPECADSAIAVTVETDAERYPADRQPSFTLAVENVSDEACSRDVGQSANELRVTSGGAEVWSSDHCNPGGSVDETNLDPGDRFVQTVSWPKVVSAEGCPTPQESADPGTYQVVARNLDVLSEPAVFLLE
jgi:type IV secretory pathway VirB10-like protein